MKYLCLAYYDAEKFETLPPGEIEAIGKQCAPYDEALRGTGRLLMSASLGLPHASTTLRPGRGRPSVIDGPFTETKEQVGGFFLIEADDLDEALRVAAQHPAAHLGAELGWGIEVRPVGHFEQP